jgi:hypothetical protein
LSRNKNTRQPPDHDIFAFAAASAAAAAARAIHGRGGKRILGAYESRSIAAAMNSAAGASLRWRSRLSKEAVNQDDSRIDAEKGKGGTED